MTATRDTPLARWRSSRGASAAISADWLGCSAPLPTPASAAAANAIAGVVANASAAVAAGQRQPGAHRRRPRADAVDDRARHRRHHDGDAAEQADDDAGEPEAEAARLVQVDDLEREDGAVAEHAEEDPGLDDPQLAREPDG